MQRAEFLQEDEQLADQGVKNIVVNMSAGSVLMVSVLTLIMLFTSACLTTNKIQILAFVYLLHEY